MQRPEIHCGDDSAIAGRRNSALALRTAAGWAFLLIAVNAGAAAQPFRDVAHERGLDFVHSDFRTGEKFYVESAESGGGFVDFDGDGDADVLLLQGAAAPVAPGARMPAAQAPRSRKLFENRDGRFVDVTERSGVAGSGFGMGVCVGDVDADGRVDILVTEYAALLLFRNLGGGRFEEIAARAGLEDRRWNSGCAFGDVDGDGDHDLYVARYVDFSFDRNPWCGDRARGVRAYCRPDAFSGVADSLYINDGKGRFVDESRRRGIAAGADEKGFGVLMQDLDGDFDLDIFVANDGTPSRHYVNRGDGFFADEALLLGTAVSNMGAAQAGMGLAAGDVDGDGTVELVKTNYSTEPNNLYRKIAPGLWEDEGRRRGVAEASWPHVGWGVELFDADNDGDLDLAVANGHAVDNIEIFEAGLAYAQPNQLFANDGSGRFTDLGASAGPGFAERAVSRGLASADVDGDGRVDLLITRTNGPTQLLRNETAQPGHWLGLRLVDRRGSAVVLGARVEVQAGGRTLLRHTRSGGSFLSQSALDLHVGLGGWSGPVTVAIRWPDGATQTQSLTTLDRLHVVVQTSAAKAR
ncbi:MAG: CRTAC1 family protein [Thermoanaerobaculia bacterium]|nr:CRTAC1 family protein [Thermoanaerobaculia bacterium]MBP9823025.1 CRTAC1 family protein [Thermoanaerobaculia bacterium]